MKDRNFRQRELVAKLPHGENETPCHIVVRYADKLAGGVDTIERHKQVIKRVGHVWFGKIGKGLSSRMISVLNVQVCRSVATYVYLATRYHDKYRLTRGRIENVQSHEPKVKKAVPRYYGRLPKGRPFRLWVLIKELVLCESDEVRSLFLRRSGRPLTQVLRTSMASVFVVQKEIPVKIHEPTRGHRLSERGTDMSSGDYLWR